MEVNDRKSGKEKRQSIKKQSKKEKSKRSKMKQAKYKEGEDNTMKKKVFLAAALAAVTLFAACGGSEGTGGINAGVPLPSGATVTAAPPSNPTEAPATNPTEAPATNPTEAPATTPKPTVAPTATPKPASASNPAQTASDFDAIAGNWSSPANGQHGNLSLTVSSDGSSSLGSLAYNGDGKYSVVGTTKSLTLQKWADGSERLYMYDSYTYEDATYSRGN